MARLVAIQGAIKNVALFVEKTMQYAETHNLTHIEAYNDLLKAERFIIDAEDLVSAKSEDIVTFQQMNTAEDMNIRAWDLVNDFLRVAKKLVKTEAPKTEKSAEKKTRKTTGKKTAKTEAPAEVKAEAPKTEKSAEKKNAKTADKKTVKAENTDKTEKTVKTEKPAEKSSAWDDVKDCKMNTNGNDSKSLVGKFIIEFGKKGEFTGEELAKAFLKFKTKTGITPDEKWARRNVLLFIQKGLILCEI